MVCNLDQKHVLYILDRSYHSYHLYNTSINPLIPMSSEYLSGEDHMPRSGFTTITVPTVYYNRLVNFSEKHKLNLGQTIALLYELYYSMISDPSLSKEVHKKLEKAKKRILKRWRQIIAESKEYE